MRRGDVTGTVQGRDRCSSCVMGTAPGVQRVRCGGAIRTVQGCKGYGVGVHGWYNAYPLIPFRSHPHAVPPCQ